MNSTNTTNATSSLKPRLILVNPWIYDFAAYDLWAKPLGLLYLAGKLRAMGFAVHLIDCLDIYHPHMEKNAYTKHPIRRRYGTGKFWKQNVSKPPQLSMIPRSYSRYGMSPRLFEEELNKVKKPTAILVTSLMTYWYPGVFDAINIAKQVHPNVPVLLGGIYTALCQEHARDYSHADAMLPFPCQSRPEALLQFLEKTIPNFPAKAKYEPYSPYPAFDLLTRIDYVCLLSSSGCPFGCPYCASSFLSPLYLRRDPLELFEEVFFWHREYKVIDFAFYDDALLLDAEHHIALFLQKVINNGLSLRFHSPNGLHIAYLDRDIADLLYRAGFTTIRLGLETCDRSLHKKLGGKFSEGEFERAVASLKRAGFTTSQIGAHILVGLPGQTRDQVAETITFIGKTGAVPYLSEYSPIPHTEMWKEAVKVSRFDLASDPLFHNNTLLPCWNGDVFKDMRKLKDMAQDVRREALRSD